MNRDAKTPNFDQVHEKAIISYHPDQKYVKLKVYIIVHNSPIRRVMKNNKYDDITLSFSGSGPPEMAQRGMAICGLNRPETNAAKPIAMFGKG